MSDKPGQEAQQASAEASSKPAPAPATTTDDVPATSAAGEATAAGAAPEAAATDAAATNAAATNAAATNAAATDANNDVAMADVPSQEEKASPAPSTAPQTAPSNLASPVPGSTPARNGTPRPNGAATDSREPNSSRANSVHPDQGFVPPDMAAEHGDQVRRYLNAKVVPHLLVGVKKVAKDKPADPLRVLGEYLLQCSRESEGEAQNSS